MENSTLTKILSNYGSRIWSLVSVFIFIPLYIKLLGTENYGLIGFYSLLLGVIGFADAGMTSAIVKEFSQDNNNNYKFSVLRKLENVYLLVCVIIAIIIICNSGIISTHWLKSETISNRKLMYYVSLIGVGVSIQLISSLYFGALFALNKQVKSNVIQLCWSFSRSALVLILLYFVAPSLELYLWWQIFCNILYIILLRGNIIKTLSINHSEKLQIVLEKIPKHIVLYINGMILIAIISSINIQADKIITSSIFRLDIFGYYNIASTLAQIPVIVGTPLISFVFPLLSKFALLEDEPGKSNVKIIFEKVFFLLNLVVIISSFLIIIYAKDIILLWTHGVIPKDIFPDIIFDVRLLIIGSLFLAVQFPFYYFLLAKGKTKYTVYQGIIQLFLGLPLLYFCANKYGLKGIPIPWVLINFGSFIYLMIIVFKRYLQVGYIKFFTRIFFIPILCTLFCSLSIYFIYDIVGFSFIPYVFFTGLISLLAIVFLTNKAEGEKIFSFRHFYNFPNE